MEHLRVSSPIYDHANISDHHTKLKNFAIVDRELHIIARTIKKAISIRVTYSSLNRNTGKYQLPHMWDEVLFNTPDLYLKWSILLWSIRPTAQGSPYQPIRQDRRAHTLCLQHQQSVSMVPATSLIWCLTSWYQVPLFTHSTVPSMVSINFAKYNIFPQT